MSWLYDFWQDVLFFLRMRYLRRKACKNPYKLYSLEKSIRIHLAASIYNEPVSFTPSGFLNSNEDVK